MSKLNNYYTLCYCSLVFVKYDTLWIFIKKVFYNNILILSYHIIYGIMYYSLINKYLIKDLTYLVESYLIESNYSILNISHCVIRKLENKVNWRLISKYPSLSKHFLREFKDKIDFEYITKYRKRLNEKFIFEFKNYITWCDNGINYKLSGRFIYKFKDYIVWVVAVNLI